MKITDLKLPSRLHEDADRMVYLQEQVTTLRELGLATRDNQLTPLGESMEKWIGRTDLAYAAQLQKRFKEGATLSEVAFWLVATALSETPATALRNKHNYFVDYDGSHSGSPHKIDVWPAHEPHEDIAVFKFIASLATTFPQVFWQSGLFGRALDEDESFIFMRWCNYAGVNSRKVLQAKKAIEETWRLFSRVNGKSAEYKALFQGHRPDRPTMFEWEQLHDDLPVDTLHKQLSALSGTTTTQISFNEAINAFEWRSDQHGHRGLLSQDDTPVQLHDGQRYTVRLVPSREAKGGSAAWSVSHLGCKPVVKKIRPQTGSLRPVVEKESPQQRAAESAPKATTSAPKRQSWLKRIFGW